MLRGNDEVVEVAFQMTDNERRPIDEPGGAPAAVHNEGVRCGPI
jgi:hypothetical protein